MKKRILSNWTFTRALYLIMGVIVIIQAAMSRQWLGIAIGTYFAAMGLFAFGCASGTCYSAGGAEEPKERSAVQKADPEE